MEQPYAAAKNTGRSVAGRAAHRLQHIESHNLRRVGAHSTSLPAASASESQALRARHLRELFPKGLTLLD